MKSPPASAGRSTRAAHPKESESISVRLKKSIASYRKVLDKVAAAYLQQPSGAELHAVRVTLRRISALAALFHGYPAERDGEGIKRQAGKLRRRLSAPRQREISASLLRRIASEDAEVELGDALLVLGRQGDSEVAPDLRSGIALIAASLRAWSASVSAMPIDEDDLRESVGKRLRRARRRLRSAGVPSKRSLHRLRVAGKALRYGLELVEGIEANAVSIIEHSKDFQNSLGEANDWAEVSYELRRAHQSSIGDEQKTFQRLCSRIKKERARSLSSARRQTRIFLKVLEQSSISLGKP